MELLQPRHDLRGALGIDVPERATSERWEADAEDRAYVTVAR